MAIVSDKNLEADYCKIEDMPGVHPTAGVFKLCVTRSRAGNAAMWDAWLDCVCQWTRELRQGLVDQGISAEWSARAVVTLDGEQQQLDAILKPAFLDRCASESIVFYKFPSACSLVLQPNDLSKMHANLHSQLTQAKNHQAPAADSVKACFISQAKRMWPANVQLPSISKLTSYANLFGAFKVCSYMALRPDVVQKGWVLAGLRDRKLDFEQMATGFTFASQRNDAACMSAWKTIAYALAERHYLYGSLTEVHKRRETVI